MTSKEVNVSFSLTISLEDALALLSRCNNKTSSPLSVEKAKSLSIHSDKSTEKVEPPKREPVYHFLQTPLPTLRRVLSALSAKYGLNTFRTADARAIAIGLGLSRTIAGYALQWAVQTGELRKVSMGNYTFSRKAKYEIASDSLVDIVASQEQTERILSILRLIAHVSKTTALYINEQGLAARFFANQDRTCILSVFVGKDVFGLFHLNAKHVRLQVSLSSLLDVFPKGRKQEFHLKVVKQNAAFMTAGYLGNEHMPNLLGCEVSESPYEVETPLEEIKDYAEVQLPRALFRDILRDVSVHSDVVRIVANKQGIVIDSSLESRGYSKTLVPGTPGLKLDAPVSIEQCFSIESILPLVRNRIIGAQEDALTLRINKQVMMISHVREKDLQVACYVSPCKVEEAAAPVESTPAKPVTKAEFKDLVERIDKLTRQMGPKPAGDDGNNS